MAAAVERRVGRRHVADLIEQVVLSAWVDATLAADPRCATTRAADRDLIVAQFRQLDRVLVDHAAERVIDACNARRPRSTVGPVAVIKREGEKKTRHMPIRTLLATAGSVSQDLKPCFMMSPLTVSQFLPPTLQFDVVLFDEASQVRPGDAIGAIYRGCQLIVAGDNKQLPPTSFFDRSIAEGSDEYDEEQLDTFESVLDLCR